jgi:uncharacterized membrane protein YdjX (TVP38/TMEM64 family)
MEIPRVFASKRGRRTAIVGLGVLVGLWILATLVLRQYVPGITDPQQLKEYVLTFGPLAPAAFVLLQAAQVVVAPIPGQVVALAGGYLFGTLAGTAYSILGATIGSYVAFALARRYGREFVERTLDPDFLDQFDAFAGDWGLLSLFLAFLVPGLPDDAICFVAGVTTLSIPRMVVVSFFGRIPTYFLTNFAGAELASGRLLEAGVVAAFLLAVSGVGYLKRDAILRRIRGVDEEEPV